VLPSRVGVSESLDEAVDRRLVPFCGGALVVGERDLDEHPLKRRARQPRA
jgi:hypothetical protein